MKTNLFILAQISANTGTIFDTIFHEFTKQIDLPFTPFIGLTIDLNKDEEDEDVFDVKEVHWHHPTQEFHLHTDDHIEQSTNKTGYEPLSSTQIIQYYTKLGWTHIEDNNPHG